MTTIGKETLYLMYLKLEKKIETLQAQLDAIKSISVKPPSESKLLELPDHLRKTLMAVQRGDKPMTAKDISELTNRARAVESAYANVLVREGWLAKIKHGRKKFFRMPVTLEYDNGSDEDGKMPEVLLPT